MTEQDYWQMRIDAEIRHMDIYYQDISYVATRPSTVYKPKIYIDGDEWCALFGDDIVSGVAGFGKSPEKAFLDFDKNWERTLPNPPK